MAQRPVEGGGRIGTFLMSSIPLQLQSITIWRLISNIAESCAFNYESAQLHYKYSLVTFSPVTIL